MINLEQQKELATDQLFEILREIGPTDHEFIKEELYQMMSLYYPSKDYKKGITDHYSGTWDNFRDVWVAFHVFNIAKRMWRKFERIAKKYPNFDSIVLKIAEAQKELDKKDD